MQEKHCLAFLDEDGRMPLHPVGRAVPRRTSAAAAIAGGKGECQPPAGFRLLHVAPFLTLEYCVLSSVVDFDRRQNGSFCSMFRQALLY